MKRKIAIVLCCLTLSGCAGIKLISSVGVNLISYTVKLLIPWGSESSKTGKYKVGNPYTIKGVKYYPEEDWTYDETGVASWYGGGDDNFNGKKTANGETYNTRDLTAAHKTLPMPSFVKVTNLENGRRIVLRINDRGPYARGRIIDVSQKAAELLGFSNKGTAKVRVQILGKESKEIAKASRAGKDISNVKFPKDVRDIESLANISETQIPRVAVSSNNIYVQAGSFSVRKNAEKFKVDLASLGNVIIEDVWVNGTQFYRVQLGPVGTIGQADVLLDELFDIGIKNPKITIK